VRAGVIELGTKVRALDYQLLIAGDVRVSARQQRLQGGCAIAEYERVTIYSEAIVAVVRRECTITTSAGTIAATNGCVKRRGAVQRVLGTNADFVAGIRGRLEHVHRYFQDIVAARVFRYNARNFGWARGFNVTRKITVTRYVHGPCLEARQSRQLDLHQGRI